MRPESAAGELRASRSAFGPLARARVAVVAVPVVLASLAAGAAVAQTSTASIVGVVRNRQTLEPVSGAIARLAFGGRSVSVDSAGRFELTGLRPGAGLLQIRAIGYSVGSWAVTLHENGTVADTFDMDPVPVVMEPLVVAGTAIEDWRSPAGFERRRQKGDGYFITEQQIKEQHTLTLVELLRQVPGVYTICHYFHCSVYLDRSSPPCEPDYFLDGYPASLSVGPDFPIEGIRGIEVYGDAFSAPVEFQKIGLTCGVVAIWTKMER